MPSWAAVVNILDHLTSTIYLFISRDPNLTPPDKVAVYSSIYVIYDSRFHSLRWRTRDLCPLFQPVPVLLSHLNSRRQFISITPFSSISFVSRMGASLIASMGILLLILCILSSLLVLDEWWMNGMGFLVLMLKLVHIGLIVFELVLFNMDGLL